MLIRCWLKAESTLDEGYILESMLTSSKLGRVFELADSMLARCCAAKADALSVGGNRGKPMPAAELGVGTAGRCWL